ncbi:MAG: GGDEF domain-containing protein [Acidimicrobiia bacterium]|nr:GGDEF domain-containing protein [Acidimicrobiia bacterium]
MGARAQLAYPVAGFVLVAFAARGSGNDAGVYAAVFTLLFALTGFSQSSGTCVALMPLALGALRLGSGATWDSSVLVPVTFEIAVGVVAGEAVALVLRRQRRVEIHIERLLHAVRVLVRVTDEREGAEVLAVLASDLLEADAAVVYLADQRAPQRFLSRTWSGHPALADTAPLVLDAEKVCPGAVEHYADARAAGMVGGSKRSRARAVAIVPLAGEHGPLGAIVLLWATSHRSLPRSARQVAELLSQEAARRFDSMRAAAVLVLEAETDPLTCLANRRTFSRALETLIPGDALVVVDLDHFKSVNDTYGHAAGDETLRCLARCLTSVSRQVDCVARYGGEEFALVLVGAGEKGARTAVRRLRSAWSESRPVTTFSAGVAIHESGDLAAETLKRADFALYRAKESGRDRVEFATQEIVLS